MDLSDELLTAPSIAKQLASSSLRIRSNAISLLQSRLPSMSSISEDEMLMIWKGLFYCLWHSDQQQQVGLVERLASLLCTLPPSLSLLYFSCFLLIIHREWLGIDSLRLDKFCLLIRRFLRRLFFLLKSRPWQPEFYAQFIDLIERSFLPIDGLPVQGASYQIADVFMDELMIFLPLQKDRLELLLKPFLAVLEKSSDKVLVGKIRLRIFDVLLEGGRRLLERQIKDSEKKMDFDDRAEKLGVTAVVMGFSRQFLDISSSPYTVQANRMVLSALYEAFLKLEKELEPWGIDFCPPAAEEVASIDGSFLDLVESGIGSENGWLGGSPKKNIKKKKKKSKKANKMKSGCDKKSKNKEEGEKVEKKSEELAIPASAENLVRMKEDNREIEANITLNKTVTSNFQGQFENISAEAGDTMAESAPAENLVGMEVNNGEIDAATTFNETAVSNLQEQFEGVAAEAGMDLKASRMCERDSTAGDSNFSTKRKRGENEDALLPLNVASIADANITRDKIVKSCEKSAKKVKFSMKSNLIWEPPSPLPPHCLRIPPSAAPRGSALKKGIPAGPVGGAALVKKRKRKRKAMKGLNAVKNRRKLQTLPI